MYVIMGGTGHVGSATADELLRRGEPVAMVTRNARRADPWRAKGAEVIEANVDDVPALRAAFQRGKRALLLNPPADPGTDTDAVETRTVAYILAALQDSGLEKVVAQSTGGAQPGERIGDLSVLWQLEVGLRRQTIPAAINRAAYYMSNWDELLPVVRGQGVLPTLFPADLPIPMVAPRDVGQAAAQRLSSPVSDVGIRYIEGPKHYSPADVAQAFAVALGRPVEPAVTPREKWTETFLRWGFSKPAAASYTRMIEVSVDNGFDSVDDPWRGSTSLGAYVHELVARAKEEAR